MLCPVDQAFVVVQPNKHGHFLQRACSWSRERKLWHMTVMELSFAA